MKIRQLFVEGFRSLKKVVWEPGDLNVLIGPNGSGKSNLLRVLEMISVSAQGGLGKYVQAAGGMMPLVWDGEAKEVAVKIKTTPPEPVRDPKTDSLTYDVHLSRIGQPPRTELSGRCWATITGWSLATWRSRSSSWSGGGSRGLCSMTRSAG